VNAEKIGTELGIVFHPQQLAAICAPPGSPVQLVAGAGSGKTTVMAARVMWLVGGGHLRPEQVLGLTFTNKAAAGLAAKIRAGLSSFGRGSAAAGEPTVSTYHAYAGRLVREHGLRVGAPPDARLLADATRFQLAGQVMRAYRGPLPYLDKAPSTVVGALVGMDAACADHLVEPAEVRGADLARAAELDQHADLVGTDRGVKGWHDGLRECARAMRARAELCLLVQAYRDAKRERGLVDFADHIATAVAIAGRCPQVAAGERARYPAVLLDEYQDTSVAQRLMLTGLFGDGHPVTAVGDPCQAIYGWRGASVHNLLAFPTHFPQRDGRAAATLSLAVSQRSGGRLLIVANRLSAELRQRHAVAKLSAPAERAAVGQVVVARHERFEDELAWLADKIRGELDRPVDPVPPGQVAVLLRAWKHAGAVHAALTEAGIPVEVVGLGGLLALPEVADLVATLEVLDDPTANAAVIRLLAGPRWMLDPRDLRALGSYARRLAGPDPDGSGRTDPDGSGRPEPGGSSSDPLQDAVAGTDPCDVVALCDALDELAGSHVGAGRPSAADGLSAQGVRRAGALGRELRVLRRWVPEPLLDLVSRVLTLTGLEVEVAASPAAVGARRRESLGAFLDVVAGYTAVDGDASLHGFLAYLRAADDYDRGFDAALPTGGEAVQVLTVHKAKGLEWDVVALPDLTATVFPSTQDKGQWPTSFSVLPVQHRQDGQSMPAGPDWTDKGGLAAFRDRCRRHQRLEEDRLGYVAVTRARRLVLASSHLWGPTQAKPRQPSDYLLTLKEHAEAGNGRVEQWVEDTAEERNPYLAGLAYTWPAPLDEAATARRTAAAQAVRAFRADPAAAIVASDRELPGPDAARFADYDAQISALLTEARENRNDVVRVPLPAALTASQVLRLAGEPNALARDLVRPLPRRPLQAAARGTAFHAWVQQRFALTPLLEPDELEGAADAALDDGELAVLQRAFLASPWSDLRPHAVEAPFTIVLGGRVIRGQIDAVYPLSPGAPDGCRWHVVDWKTGLSPSDPLQLAIYRAAWAMRVGVPERQVRASFLAVRSGELLTPGQLPTSEDLSALLA